MKIQSGGAVNFFQPHGCEGKKRGARHWAAKIIKLCGLKKENEVHLGRSFGARFFGFVFSRKSVRYVCVDEICNWKFYDDCNYVAVFEKGQNDFSEIYYILQKGRIFNYVQLHGYNKNDLIYIRFLIENIKYFSESIKIIFAVHFDEIENVLCSGIEDLCDFLLIDGKNAGSGEAFDWNLLEIYNFKKNFFLAGGICKENVKKALKYTNCIDISSGIETNKGIKDEKKIIDLLSTVFDAN